MVYLRTDREIYRQKLGYPPVHAVGTALPTPHDRRPCTMVSVRWPFEKVVPSDPMEGRSTAGVSLTETEARSPNSLTARRVPSSQM